MNLITLFLLTTALFSIHSVGRHGNPSLECVHLLIMRCSSLQLSRVKWHIFSIFIYNTAWFLTEHSRNNLSVRLIGYLSIYTILTLHGTIGTLCSEQKVTVLTGQRPNVFRNIEAKKRSKSCNFQANLVEFRVEKGHLQF